MSYKTLALSIIILAHNEERQLSDCLDSIAAQTMQPHEVIVVDNDSTDGTVAVASRYPFVKVVHEPVLGMIPARNAGFAAASGDVFARLDADAKLSPDWVARVLAHFANDSIQAVGGVAKAQLLPVTRRYESTLWCRMYLWWMKWKFNIPILWGANMAIRRSAWEKIYPELHTDGDMVHEDQDISVLLAKYRLDIVIDKRLIARSDNQDKNEMPKYYAYVAKMHRTIRHHKQQGSFATCRPVYHPVVRAALLLVYVPIKTVYLVGMLVSTFALLIRSLAVRGYRYAVPENE